MAKSSNSVCLSFDFDGMSLWIGSFQSNNPSMISRGEFALVGLPRLLDLLRDQEIPATFFVPGTRLTATRISSSGSRARATRSAITAGCTRIRPSSSAMPSSRSSSAASRRSSMQPESARSDTARPPGTSARTRSTCCSTSASSTTPAAWRATSIRTTSGRATGGRRRSPTSSESSSIWSSCLRAGGSTTSRRSSTCGAQTAGPMTPSQVKELWQGEFDYMVGNCPGGVYILTCHPQFIGRGARITMLRELIEHMKASDVKFERLRDVAARFKEENPREAWAQANPHRAGRRPTSGSLRLTRDRPRPKETMTASTPEARLEAMGLSLPPPPEAVANYVGLVQRRQARLRLRARPGRERGARLSRQARPRHGRRDRAEGGPAHDAEHARDAEGGARRARPDRTRREAARHGQLRARLRGAAVRRQRRLRSAGRDLRRRAGQARPLGSRAWGRSRSASPSRSRGSSRSADAASHTTPPERRRSSSRCRGGTCPARALTGGPLTVPQFAT